MYVSFVVRQPAYLLARTLFSIVRLVLQHENSHVALIAVLQFRSSGCLRIVNILMRKLNLELRRGLTRSKMMMKLIHESGVASARVITVAVLLACTADLVYAQAIPNPGAAQRAIEQNLELLQQPVVPLTRPERPTPSVSLKDEKDIEKLSSLVIEVPPKLSKLTGEIESYWAKFLDMPVRGVQINEFKAWLWDELLRVGYLAYITINSDDTANGTTLRINVLAPTIDRATVLALDFDKKDEYSKLVAKRFAQTLPPGSLVDVQGIEAQLNAMAYDLPVSLEASLRRSTPESVDVAINMKRLDNKPGSINSGLVQFNNYGLKAYGREQLLGVIRVQGPRPLSEFLGIAEVSRGTQYVRGDYSQALEGYASRWNVYASGMRNRAQNELTIGTFNQLGRSAEIGAGFTTLLRADRTGTWFSNVEIAQRWSDSDIQHLFRTREREDSQLRMALRSAHSHSWADRLTTDTMLTFGNLRLKSDDIGFGQFDSRYLEGNYLKLNHNGNYQKALPADPRWTLTTRWRFQLASQNMDSYNQFSLGGVNGIRAFNSDEGVGDQGAQLSLDLTRQIVPQLYVGIFYDMGIVQPRRKPASDTYSLQGAGVSLGGNITKGLDWSLSGAKSFGPTPPANNAINEKIGSWRAFFALTQRF